MTEQEINERIGPNSSIVYGTYTNMRGKATFVDAVHGEWTSRADYVINSGGSHPKRAREKREASSLAKYGVKNVAQDRTTMVKAQKTKGRSNFHKHWLTGEEILTTGSYEKAVVDWLNFNQKNYQWQIPYKLPDGSLYFVDAYIPELDLYVEIKGYWRDPEAKLKWLEFSAANPNSEVWMRKQLVQRGILVA